MTLTPIERTVKEAYPADHAVPEADYIRLGGPELTDLNLAPGDEVNIEAADGTTILKRVWRSDRVDWDKDIVRMNDHIRRQLGVEPGDTVTIHPIPAQQRP